MYKKDLSQFWVAWVLGHICVCVFRLLICFPDSLCILQPVHPAPKWSFSSLCCLILINYIPYPPSLFCINISQGDSSSYSPAKILYSTSLFSCVSCALLFLASSLNVFYFSHFLSQLNFHLGVSYLLLGSPFYDVI